jgi:nitrile hydratase
MDGVHDMGGMDGFGKVEPEPNEPVFHHRWEGRVLAMSRAIGVFRAWTIDTSRYAIEKMAPSIYLTRPYYEKWFLRNQQLLIERGLIDSDEVAAGRALRPPKKRDRSHCRCGKITRRGSLAGPRRLPLLVGDRVRTKTFTVTHTLAVVRGHGW